MDAAVVLVSGLQASEHDSFSGACGGKIVTPQQARGDGVQSGGGWIEAGEKGGRAAIYQGTSTNLLHTVLLAFSPHEGRVQRRLHLHGTCIWCSRVHVLHEASDCFCRYCAYLLLVVGILGFGLTQQGKLLLLSCSQEGSG